MFPVNIFPVHCRYSNPFFHLRSPTSHLLPSRISSIVVSIPVVPNLCHHSCLPLSSLLTLSATPIILEQLYDLRLVVVPCQYFPNPLPFFQPISPSPLYYISSVAVPHLVHRRIHTCCPVSPPPFSSAAVFTADLVYHTYYPESPPRLHCYPPASLMRSLSHYLSSSRVLCCRCLSTFSDRILSSLCIVMYYTVFSSLLHTTFLTIPSDLLTTVFF